MNRFIPLILLLLSFILISGCAYRDIDKRHFVTAVGVDKIDDEEHPYEITLKIALPPSDPKAFSNESLILSEKAESISEAVRLIKANVSKELDFGHMKLMLYGKDMLDGHVRKMLDWASRRRDIQQISWIAVGEPSAKEILEIKPKEETIPSNFIFLAFSEEGTETPYLIKTRLFEFRRDMLTEGKSAILPLIKKSNEEDQLEMDRSVVFGKEKNNYLILDQEETKNLNILMGHVQKTDVKVKDEQHNFQIAISKINSNYKIASKNKIKFKVKMEGIIEESKQTLHQNDLTKYVKIAEQESSKRTHKLLEHLRDSGFDPIGFGLRYKARSFNNDNEFNTWKTLYKDIDFDVEMQTHVRSTGVVE